MVAGGLRPPEPRGGGDDRRGVESAAQAGSDVDVAAQAHLHRVLEQTAELFRRAGADGGAGKFVPAASRDPAVLVHTQAVAPGQGSNVGEERAVRLVKGAHDEK